MDDLITAEFQVRQLHSRYADAVWRKDIDAFMDCFAEGCEWRIAGRVVAGRPAIRSFMTGVFGQFQRILLTMRTPCVDLTDTGANARTYFTENSVMADGTPLAAIGSYYERIANEGERWRFAWRVFRTEYAGPPDFSGPLYDNPDYGPPPAMPPLDAIPVDHSQNLKALP